MKAAGVIILLWTCCSRGLSLSSATRPPENVTVRQGESALLRCALEGASHRVAWLNRSVIVFAGDSKWSSDARLSLERSNEREYGLRINRATPNDEGPYTCSQQGARHAMASHVFLLVQVPPQITKVSEEQTVSEGADVTMTCQAEGRPEPVVTWRHLQPPERTLEADGEVLHLESVSRDQAGEYECLASNEAGPPATRRLQFNVNFAPSMVLVRLVGPGRPNQLRCDAPARPAPQFHWFKNDRRLTAGFGGIQLATQGAFSTLTFPNVTQHHYGNYTCFAHNTLGTGNASIVLNRATAITHPAHVKGILGHNGYNSAPVSLHSTVLPIVFSFCQLSITFSSSFFFCG
uniref:limbic system-associated membrane protein-like n=1 Tax=Myxine glutinosa TaxID=7769 RepID=UPI00358FE66A